MPLQITKAICITCHNSRFNHEQNDWTIDEILVHNYIIYIQLRIIPQVIPLEQLCTFSLNDAMHAVEDHSVWAWSSRVGSGAPLISFLEEALYKLAITIDVTTHTHFSKQSTFLIFTFYQRHFSKIHLRSQHGTCVAKHSSSHYLTLSKVLVLGAGAEGSVAHKWQRQLNRIIAHIQRCH